MNFPETGLPSRQTTTADEYRQIADRLLDHCGTDETYNDVLTYLAGRLYVVAVQVESRTASSLIEGGGASGAQVAPDVTRPEVGHSAGPQGV